ncbi:hypothetical protein [Paraburkholderia caribensis]|uniref:hypothetical protein n=1 Tax=Paraburkholderia caribensis TaxID=75105 RepID=UPI0015911BBB|nr:hypothetical protein [Paraburkholderia caribensis]
MTTALRPGGTQMDEKHPQEQDDARRTGTTTQPGEPTETAKATNPPRSNPHPKQTAEVPLGSGDRPEPPGTGGHPSHSS